MNLHIGFVSVSLRCSRVLVPPKKGKLYCKFQETLAQNAFGIFYIGDLRVFLGFSAYSCIIVSDSILNKNNNRAMEKRENVNGLRNQNFIRPGQNFFRKDGHLLQFNLLQ